MDHFFMKGSTRARQTVSIVHIGSRELLGQISADLATGF